MENFRTVKQMLKNTVPAGFDNVLAQPSILFSVVLMLRSQFQDQNFYFQVYGNMVEENIMYQWLQQICRKFAA